MSNWKQYPNLFANGKFKVKYGDLWTGIIIGSSIHQIHDHSILKENSSVLIFKIDGEKVRSIAYKRVMDNCQLIARPIEDMTDEEWDEIRGYNEVGFHHEDGRDVIYTTALSAGLMLHLLSIGVYPFSDTEDVIF